MARKFRSRRRPRNRFKRFRTRVRYIARRARFGRRRSRKRSGTRRSKKMSLMTMVLLFFAGLFVYNKFLKKS